MKQQLRVVAEVAGVGTMAMSLPLLGMFASVPVFNFFGSWGINLSFLDKLGLLLFYAFPFALAFCYGYMRRIQFHFVALWIGWAIAWMLYSQIASMTMNRVFPPTHRAVAAHWHWWSVPLWLGWLFAFSLLPAFTTMWGQRLRMRAAQPSD